MPEQQQNKTPADAGTTDGRRNQSGVTPQNYEFLAECGQPLFSNRAYFVRQIETALNYFRRKWLAAKRLGNQCEMNRIENFVADCRSSWEGGAFPC